MGDERTTPSPLQVDARSIATGVSALEADADRAGAFRGGPIAVLAGTSLPGALVPAAYGGAGTSLVDFVEAALTLAGSGLATAFAWAMHCQQVDVLARYAAPGLADRVLPDVAAGRLYLASATTELHQAASLLAAEAPLVREEGCLRLRRHAPVVTGGDVAGGFLVTMRDGPDAPADAVTLLYVGREQGSFDVTGRLDMLGMRGLGNVALDIDARVPPDQVVGERGRFRAVAVEAMAPVGHLAWSACWLGAARGCMQRVAAELRRRRTLLGEAKAIKLARARMELEAACAYLTTVAGEVDRYRAADRSLAGAETQIHLNSLKVLAAEASYSCVNRLIEVVGLGDGYLRSSPLRLEQALRDLRSASLNYGDDRLLAANGQLALVDRPVRLAGLLTAD